ncbi:hypothetical protein GGTG_13679 [Gaeumannomyces tritici R3-111a-1]|uniref:Uncharacterized protein n=1 Tax=Gaeumannomyces tritici (strain R3-111a-1) TaxID=644352 RepID=J3PJJ3_GAET3|nr:hypothetical protein GGTG_13679 [Gaeumannomyces tritici R3-111a-1]EJT68749.1 hypothetical protein GGTG_13679 [Gaeumannomyces tritici R3-111a-1]
MGRGVVESLSETFHTSSGFIDVSERYRYGEIRLTRLDFYARLLVGLHTRYQSLEPQYSDYFARIYGPILFCIGILSLVLSSLY